MEQSLLMELTVPGDRGDATSLLRYEYQTYQSLYQVQQPCVRQDLDMQAASIAEAVIQGSMKVHFHLPKRIKSSFSTGGEAGEDQVPLDSREQRLGGRTSWLVHTDLFHALRQRFVELEGSSNRAISVSAVLLRHATALYLVRSGLPTGRSVAYKNVVDDIPNQPVEMVPGNNTSLTSILGSQDQGDGLRSYPDEPVVPYVKDALRFFLPQWVAFDSQGNLLTGSVSGAEAYISSMQSYLSILASAAVLAPYIIVDEGWQQKHYGMLGQLVNQGRALARYQAGQIVQTIERRVEQHKLDRGLRLSLPYFNDRTLMMEEYRFDVIPAGRIMFVPAFVVLAVRAQGVRIAQNLKLSQSTRRHLLMALSMFEKAFLR